MIYLQAFRLTNKRHWIPHWMSKVKTTCSFDRLKYILLQSSDRETFNDSTRKDNKANFSKSNVRDYNYSVPGKRVIWMALRTILNNCPQHNDNACLHNGKNDSNSKQIYHGHWIKNCHHQRMVILLSLPQNTIRTLKGSTMMKVSG